MKMFRIRPYLFLTVALAVHPTLVFPQSPCSTTEVRLGNNYVQVTPNGEDDTANLQCVLDLAIERRIPEIRLTRGDFYIGSLQARNFVGVLQGSGRERTRLILREGSIDDCGNGATAITVAGGAPHIRWLSVVWNGGSPCVAGWLETLIHLTGTDPCSNSPIYATLDRVAIEGPWSELGPPSVGVSTSPPDTLERPCGNLLLGTLRVNRSAISGFATGILVNMQGGAQVSLFENTITGNNKGLVVRGSKAHVTVSGNYFASKADQSVSSCLSAGVGISVIEDTYVYGFTRLDLHANVFDVSAGCNGFGVSLQAEFGAITIAGNRFRMRWGSGSDGYEAAAIHVDGPPGGMVGDNTFELESPDAAGLVVQANDWTIVQNTGFPGNEAHPDIELRGCANVLIGPDQGASVLDLGFGNTVLPQ